MRLKRIIAIVLILAAGAVGYFVDNVRIQFASPARFSLSLSKSDTYKLGLDLNGGTHLLYRADTSRLEGVGVKDAMTSLRDVIERRVNLFGVAEPIVQSEEGGAVGQAKEERLIVELPGVTDVSKAIALIGKTPLLEFRLAKTNAGFSEADLKKTADELFEPPKLTGQYLDHAELTFDQTTRQPRVLLSFNTPGTKLFADITKANVGRVLAIFLDGTPISMPVIRQEIDNGKAEISGNFTPDEARTLVRNLNYGALPVPIELISTQTIGPSLGQAALDAGARAGKYAFLVIALFLILWYRLPGFVAVVALLMYVVLNLAIFKLIPVTLTAAGIAGFILSIGMAVDANILIFARMREEFKAGKNLEDAIKEGFGRAWLSIRDSNLSSIITAIILYWSASTSVVKGFALVFGIGVLTSMLTAITVSRTLLMALGVKGENRFTKFLFSSGLLSSAKKLAKLGS